MGNLDSGTELKYELKDRSNGVYAFILEGNATINEQDLEKRDGLGVWDTDDITIKSKSDTRILLMEVPMNI